MRKLLLVTALGIFVSSIEAQPINLASIGRIDSINSKTINEKREIWVHVPASAKSNPKRKYPVIYLLDAGQNFVSAEGVINFLSSVNGNNFWPEIILVGIVNTTRTRDLTPTHVTKGLWIDSATASISGGGEAFMGFIANELIPHIDSAYPTSPYRIFIGHSLGGLMVINALVHHKNLFKGYVAIDPSMWWDGQALLQEVEHSLHTTSYSGISVFLGMAHTQPGEMDTLGLQKDTSNGTLHPRSILRLGRYLSTSSRSGLQATFKYYDEETHGSVPLIATYDALHFIFKDYPLVIKDSYYSDPTFKFAPFLIKHFEDLSAEYNIRDDDGKALLPPEDIVNNLAYYLFNEKKQFDKARELFLLNLKNYPGSFLTYEFLGDLYRARGDKQGALTNYKKSLSIKETPDARKRLETLEQIN